MPNSSSSTSFRSFSATWTALPTGPRTGPCLPAELPLRLPPQGLDFLALAAFDPGPGESQRLPRAVSGDDAPPDENPGPASPGQPEAALDREGERPPLKVISQGLVEGIEILRVEASAPVVKTHLLPVVDDGPVDALKAEMNAVGGDIPVSDAPSAAPSRAV